MTGCSCFQQIKIIKRSGYFASRGKITCFSSFWVRVRAKVGIRVLGYD